MLKTRVWKTAHEMIDSLTRENGGVPPIIDILNVPLTKENWDKQQAIIRKHFDAYAKSRQKKCIFN